MSPLLIGGAVAAVAGIVAFFVTSPAKTPPPVTPAGNQTNPVATAPASISLPGVPLPPDVKDFAELTQKRGPAAPFAHNLFDYLKAHGLDGSAKLSGLILDFQKAHNDDKIGSTLSGPIPRDGFYGKETSGALTLYTGDPIPPDPKAPIAPTPTLGQILTSKSPGAAAISGFNLYQYTKGHPFDANDKTLANLVTIFQGDVNTDPMFPGPAYGVSPKPPIMIPKLEVNGIIGPVTPESPTRKAMNLMFPPGT
jgi:hypothetical protein